MKFIFNFIFFGVLFYIIWLYFPDAFKTMVSWVSQVFDFVKNLVQTGIDKYGPSKSPSPATPTKTLLPIILMLPLLRGFWK